MSNRHLAVRLPRIKLISAAVASCFVSHLALANPTGPTIVNGQVTFNQQGNLLQITNSPNSIINWQSFSIGTNEITRFLQQSSSSAVLNRVTTQNPSSILGALQSNGRVLLINPNGILFGAGAQIDVAGLVASTLKLSDTDFLAGRLRFTDGAGAGSVVNQGSINSATGGHVYLVGPAVTNGGVITSPKGEVILAAGNSVELVNPGTPNLRVEITAPDNQAINLGQIVADSGRVGIYAGLINQSGTIRADSAVVTEDGRIVLKATKGVALEAGSVTAASGAKGGNVTVETETGTIRVAGQIDATGSEVGGAINIAVTGDSGGIELGAGLNSGNASVSVSGPGSTTILNADIITAGAAILIDDSVELGAPTSIRLDTTNSGAVPGGANVTITGTVNDDLAGSSSLVLSAGTAGANTLGGAVGNTDAIASLTASGNTTALNGGLVTTTGDQTYNSAVTLGMATTLAATGVSGNIAINNSLSGGANSLTINAGNDIAIRGNVFSGPQAINAGNGLIVQSSAAGSAQLTATAGQTINARFIDVTAQNNTSAGISNSTSGNQIITVAGGGSSPGIDVQSLASGGSASIANNASGAAQTITVTDADHINVNGFGPNISNVSAIIHAIPGTQTISITGSGANAINVGSAGALGGSNISARSQSITAGASGQSGSITIIGPAVNTRFAAISTNLGFPGAQTVSTSGALTVTGGSAPAQVFASGIRHNSSGPQTVTAASIALQGGLSGNGNAVNIDSASGDQTISASDITLAGGSGIGNFARIRKDGTGTQTISGTPVITLTGGTGGALDQGSFAQIRAAGLQVITAGPTTLTAGASGFNNFAGIHSPDQDITVHGDLTLTGGGSISGVTSSTDARIGGLGGATPSPTNLMLVVDGNVTMTGGTATNA
ncbi:MAG: beta strand repeat-containing protein, partial [Gammaproteobacteria bacterium]